MGTLDREKPKTGVTLRTEQQDQGHDPEHPRDDLRDTRAFLTPGSVVPPWYIGMCEPRIVQAPRARFVKARAIEIIWSCIKLLSITRSSQVITAHRQVRCSTP